FFINPCSNEEQDQVIAEFVDYNLFEGTTTTWLRFLEQALRMYEKGFEPFYKVYENREWAPKYSQENANRKMYTMLRKLAVRPAETITEVVYDAHGGPEAIVQYAVDDNNQTTEVVLPIEDLVVFTFD